MSGFACILSAIYTTLHCTALHCTALHCTALLCTTLHCNLLHCTALHCTALYTLQYTLHIALYNLYNIYCTQQSILKSTFPTGLLLHSKQFTMQSILCPFCAVLCVIYFNNITHSMDNCIIKYSNYIPSFSSMLFLNNNDKSQLSAIKSKLTVV